MAQHCKTDQSGLPETLPRLNSTKKPNIEEMESQNGSTLQDRLIRFSGDAAQAQQLREKTSITKCRLIDSKNVLENSELYLSTSLIQ